MPTDNDEVRKIADAIKKLIGDDSSKSSLNSSPPVDYGQKVKLFLTEEPQIEPGDLVKWKDGLKNRKYPPENTPVCVIDVLSSPIIKDDSDSGSPYFREPLDLILAVQDNNGDLMFYYYDKRRFQVYQKGVYPEAKKTKKAKAEDLVAS